MSMPICGFYPDLVCSYESSSECGVAAFEVKASFDEWVKGITQARAYREGVHRSYLALPEGSRARYSALERDAQESGVGVWLLRRSGWDEVVPSAPPRPSLLEVRNLTAALRGVILPRRLQLNHPINYLVVALACRRHPGLSPMEALAVEWSGLRSPGSRKHAVNGAGYLGLLGANGLLTHFGRTIADLLGALSVDSASIDRRKRFCSIAPALASVARFVLMQQESTRLVVQALESTGATPINTEILLRAGGDINRPLAGGLFLSNPRDLDEDTVKSSAFSPSFVFQFKQMLWHAGILSTPMHPTAGKGAAVYRHEDDMWALDEQIETRCSARKM